MGLHKFLFLLIFGVILLFPMFSLMSSSFIENPDFSFNKDTNNVNGDIKSSGNWSLGRISIDGTATGVDAHNWSWAASQPWCTGSGGLSDPYIIENITIDASGNVDCLSIKNSDVHFIVRNSTFYNAYSSGLELENVENGQLYNNTCNNNGFYGILLIDSLYCEIINNSIFSNGYGAWNPIPEYDTYGGGIALWSSHNNTIQGNCIELNRNFGITLGSTTIYFFEDVGYRKLLPAYACYHNLVSNNFLNNNGGLAIWLVPKSQYNIISDNRIISSRLFLEGSFNSKLVSNNLTDSSIEVAGSLEAESSHYIDTTNIRNGNPVYYYTNVVNLNKDNVSNAGQIILVNCSNSSIIDMDLNACFKIDIHYCSNITLNKNNLSRLITLDHTNNILIEENTFKSISLSIISSYNNSFLDNNINYTYSDIYLHDIYLHDTNYTIVSKNYFQCDNIWILIYQSYFNRLSENIIKLNEKFSGSSDRMPIQLRDSDNNTIIENEILYAEIGIYLYWSDYNTISNNLINQTDIGMYFGGSAYNSIESNTLVCNNVCFYIDSYSTGNVFENNYCNLLTNEQIIPGYFPTLVIFWIFLVSVIIYVYNQRLRKHLAHTTTNKCAFFL